MSSIIKVDTIQNQSGANIISESSNTITLGASGDTITVPSGATLNVNGTVGTFSGQNYPAFRAYGDPSQSIPNTVATKIEFNQETFDTDGNYDTSNYRFIPQVAGKYFFYASVRMAGFTTAVTNFQVYLYKNGSLVSRYAKESVNYANPNNSISDIITMNGSTDYVEVFLYHNFGSAKNTDNGSANTYFVGYRIGT